MYLALDTSTVRSSLAVGLTPADPVTGGLVAVERNGSGLPGHTIDEMSVSKQNPGEVVVSMIDSLLDRNNISKQQLTQIWVGVGPGPYTSTRVGISIARTLALALRIPVVGVCSHDAIAEQVRASDLNAGSDFLVATDARRSEVYWARYRGDGSRVVGPAVDKPAEVLVRQVESKGEPVNCWFGNGLDRFTDLVEEHGLRVGEPAYPNAAWLSEAGMQAERFGEVAPTEQPALAEHGAAADDSVLAAQRLFAAFPLYLRRPDAVPAKPRTPVGMVAQNPQFGDGLLT